MYYLVAKPDQNGLPLYWNPQVMRWQTYRSLECHYTSMVDADLDAYALRLTSPDTCVTDAFSHLITPGFVAGQPVAKLVFA